MINTIEDLHKDKAKAFIQALDLPSEVRSSIIQGDAEAFVKPSRMTGRVEMSHGEES